MSAIGSVIVICSPIVSLRTFRNDGSEWWALPPRRPAIAPAIASPGPPPQTPGSPARLPHARDHPLERQIAEADAAEAELPQVAARTPAALATVPLPHPELRLPLALLDHRLTSHGQNL